MRSRKPRFVLVGLAGSLGGNRLIAVVAHPARRRDHRDSIQLGVGATSSRAHLTERKTEVTSGPYGTHPVDRHHSNDLALTRIEVGHQVSSPRKAVLHLQPLEWVHTPHGVLNSRVELDSHTRAQAREVPSFTVPATTMMDGEPESTQQVVFVGDTTRRHHDGRDRVVHDLFLRTNRNAPCLAATP